jgi:hypothetical protein
MSGIPDTTYGEKKEENVQTIIGIGKTLEHRGDYRTVSKKQY